jgi:hypothetical protein
MEVSVQLYAPAALSCKKESPVPIACEAGWTPGPVWMTLESDKSWTYRDSYCEPSVLRSVDSRYTDCGIPGSAHYVKQ